MHLLHECMGITNMYVVQLLLRLRSCWGSELSRSCSCSYICADQLKKERAGAYKDQLVSHYKSTPPTSSETLCSSGSLDIRFSPPRQFAFLQLVVVILIHLNEVKLLPLVIGS